METVAERLAKFIREVQFGDLPEEMVRDARFVLLDSLGAIILGLSTVGGNKVLEFAKRLGGPAESSVIGTRNRLSCTNAAFANAQLMNVIDYDAVSVVHDVPSLIPAPLAMAESIHGSGENLLVAIAIAHEISKRVATASPEIFGMSAAVFGAAAGASRVLNLNLQKTAHAIGLAGYMCPPDTMVKWSGVHPSPMVKYGLSGWGAQGGVTAALLAETGFTGDIKVFEGDNCFWKYTGKKNWDSDWVTQGLGENWLSRGIIFKPYPCGI